MQHAPDEAGTRELNSPSSAKAANAATAAAMNSPAPVRGRQPGEAQAGRVRGRTVSGTSSRSRAAAARTARYTRRPAWWGAERTGRATRRPGGRGLRPPMFAAVATSDARRAAEAGISSVSAAVAVPVISPPTARDDPGRDEHADAGGQDEQDRAQRAAGEGHSHDRLRPAGPRTARQQQGGEHGRGVGGEGHRHHGEEKCQRPW